MKKKNYEISDFCFLLIGTVIISFTFMNILRTGLRCLTIEKRNEECNGKIEIETCVEPEPYEVVIEYEPVALLGAVEIDDGPVEAIRDTDDNTEIEHDMKFNERYSDIVVTDEDIELMACIVYLEAGNQCFDGQRMVAEVILNRVLQGDMGGTTIHDVVYAKNQFSTAKNVSIARPTEENFDAVRVALTETPITDIDVVFFAQMPHNDNVFCKIGGHYFCYKY